MSIIRFDPFQDLDRLLDERQRTRSLLTLDAYRRGNAMFLHFDLPGVAQDDVEVSVEKDVLTVQATRHYTAEEGDRVYARERPQEEYRRQVHLSATLHVDALAVSLKQGVLTVRVPVAEAAKPRHIAIKSGADAIGAESVKVG